MIQMYRSERRSQSDRLCHLSQDLRSQNLLERSASMLVLVPFNMSDRKGLSDSDRTHTNSVLFTFSSSSLT